MLKYLELLEDILHNGVEKTDRTGTGTLSVFGRQLRFDLWEGFPLLTTKKLHTKSIIHELLWFISGSTNIGYLRENGVTIWDEWADEDGELGPVYGYQWRRFGEHYGEFRIWDVGEPNAGGEYQWDDNRNGMDKGKDQLLEVVDLIKNDPDSRRIMICAWNPLQNGLMKLPPCHALIQFWVGNGMLSCQLYQRSCDVFLGVPFNIASYALLTHMLAQVCGLTPGTFVHTYGDLHIYNNHMHQVREQLKRKDQRRDLPTLWLNPAVKDIEAFKYEDIKIRLYNPLPAIPAPVAV